MNIELTGDLPFIEVLDRIERARRIDVVIPPQRSAQQARSWIDRNIYLRFDQYVRAKNPWHTFQISQPKTCEGALRWIAQRILKRSGHRTGLQIFEKVER